MIPYGKQSISTDDIAAVCDTLNSDFITTGPKVEEFESAFAKFAGAKHAVAVSSGTAALHCAMLAAGISQGDEVIVTPMTFAASANCILYCGGTPVFADVHPGTLLIDPAEVEAKISPRTHAVVAVDFAGQPCSYDALTSICRNNKLILITDACHSPGSLYKGRMTGSIADMTCFSFHPVKHITTGEGGMILTGSEAYASSMRAFRSHGIGTSYREREARGEWYYEMTALGYNYRITDFQCALGISQLKRLPAWLERRREIARAYDDAFAGTPAVVPLDTAAGAIHAYHLYVVRISEGLDRNKVFRELRANGIGVNLHYIPVHLHPYYVKRFGTGPGLCPVAEKAFNQILSLPIFPSMTDDMVDEVIAKVLLAVSSKQHPSGQVDT